jgi:hypothetical protein
LDCGWAGAVYHVLTVISKVTLKENASPEELTKAKDKAKADGGEIKHEFTLIKGFTYGTSLILSLRSREADNLCAIVLSSPTTRLASSRPTSTSTSSRIKRSRHNRRVPGDLVLGSGIDAS